MNELEQIRKRKLERYQNQLNEQLKSQIEQERVQTIKKSIMFKFLTKQARQRLNTIRLSRPDIAEQVEMSIIRAVQLGQLNKQIDDVALKNILHQLNSQKKRFQIRK